jgi:GT2 family glycosyltransferase
VNPPRLSVITVTHDRWALLRQKLEALTQQTLSPDAFEWIVLANACTDETLEGLRAMHPAFDLKWLESDTLLPASQARNRCAALARGSVLYFSDDDCLPEPGTLARHLEAQKRLCVAIGGLEFVHDGARERWSPQRVGYGQLNGANTSVPTRAFRQVGGFDETLTGYGGEDVLLGYALRALPFVALPDAKALHHGPNPLRGGDLEKAESAGRNAVRIAARYPELAFRLGVSRTLLALKRGLLKKHLLGRVLTPAVYHYERAYLEGALEERTRERRDDARRV